MRSLVIFLSLSLLLGTHACSRDYPPEPSTSEGGSSGFRLVVTLPGDDFPSSEDLALLESVGRLLEERGVGEVTGSEAGMGSMSLTLRVEKPGPAKEAARGIALVGLKGLRFRIEE